MARDRFVTGCVRHQSLPCIPPSTSLHHPQPNQPAKGIMVNPFIWLIFALLDIYWWIIIATIIISWLTAFNVMNRSNPYVRQIAYGLNALTEPLLRPIRRVLPDLGGLDISPIFLLIGLQFVRYLIGYYLAPLMMR
jgi:YggT family protein